MAENIRRISAIKGHSEEEIATAFAMASRVPNSIQESLAILSAEKAAKFHEKWVVGYGHSSVAEHAVLHIEMENVTRLATLAIESNRLASYTEKSTRFQKIEKGQVYLPPAVMKSKFANDYQETHRRLFAAYDLGLERTRLEVMGMIPRRDDESEVIYENRIKTKYIDICRYGLPLSVYARLGMTANARVIEAACVKMLSDELPEVREIGEEVKRVALEVTPTLVKYAASSSYMVDTRKAMTGLLETEVNNIETEVRPTVDLVKYDTEGENQFLAACLYKFGGARDFRESLIKAEMMDKESKEILINEYFSRMGPHDKGGRELEMPRLVFDLFLDHGSLNDFKRNRLMTQIFQTFTGEHGIILPAMLYKLGVAEQMISAIKYAHDVSKAMEAEFEGEHQYLFVNATMRRMLMNMNLREFGEFWITRSAPNTNPGYRYLALRMGELVGGVYPNLWAAMKKRAKAEFPSSGEVYDSFYGGF